MSSTLYYLYDCGSTTGRSPPMLLRLLHACYTHTIIPALRYYCSHRLHSPQPLPLPTANSPTCLAHSTICTTAAPRLVCSPLVLLLPLHAHYLICATTDYPLNKRLPLPSQRNG